MDTTRSRGASRIFRRSGRSVAALPSAFLIATVLSMSPVFASTPPSVAPVTPTGGFSSAPGMYRPGTRAASAPSGTGPTVTLLPADLGTPNGGFSSSPGMYPPDTSGRSVEATGDQGVTGLPADLGTPSGGFSSAPGMSPDTTMPPARSSQP